MLVVMQYILITLSAASIFCSTPILLYYLMMIYNFEGNELYFVTATKFEQLSYNLKEFLMIFLQKLNTNKLFNYSNVLFDLQRPACKHGAWQPASQVSVYFLSHYYRVSN